MHFLSAKVTLVNIHLIETDLREAASNFLIYILFLRGFRVFFFLLLCRRKLSFSFFISTLRKSERIVIITTANLKSQTQKASPCFVSLQKVISGNKDGSSLSIRA